MTKRRYWAYFPAKDPSRKDYTTIVLAEDQEDAAKRGRAKLRAKDKLADQRYRMYANYGTVNVQAIPTVKNRYPIKRKAR